MIATVMIAAALSVRIVSPGDDAYVNGPTLLRAQVNPPEAVAGITFFVDGRQTCALTALPFECDWDAGSRSSSTGSARGGHADGRRSASVQTIRTKAIAYAESRRCRVVEVTVTVSDGHGKFVPNIPQAAFHVLEDGRPQTISHFASEDVPLELVAAIDIRGSMRDVDADAEDGGQAIPRRRPAAGPGDAARVQRQHFHADAQADRSGRAREGRRSARAWGDRPRCTTSSCAGSTCSAARPVAAPSSSSPTARIRAATRRSPTWSGDWRRSDVTLYVIGQGRGVTMESLRRVMERLSNSTGGRALFTENTDDLRAPSPISSTSCRISICSGTHRPTAPTMAR